MNHISISIIIPVYNVEQYVEDCLSSIFVQMQDTDEIIIIDDGSTDGSYEICKKLTKGRNNVVLLHQHNCGQGAARNRGLAIANGDYILFVDSDDMLAENALINLKTKLKTLEVDILLFSADILIQCDNIPQINYYDKHNAVSEKIMDGKEMFSALYPKYYTSSPCLLISKRNFLIENQLYFPEGIIHEDDVFTFQSLMSAQKTACVPEKYYLRRYRPNSVMTSGWNLQRWTGTWKGTVFILNYLENCSDRIWQNEKIASAVAAFLYTKFSNIFAKKSKVFFTQKELPAKSVIQQFLSVWNTYYSKKFDSFIKWKGSFELLQLINKEKQVTGEETELLLKDADKIREQYTYYITQKLKLLPFKQKEKRIGVYGKGQHTEKMMFLYRKLIGEPECYHVFVDSFVQNENSFYLDRPVINIQNIKGRVDCFVISSFSFQDELNENINNVLGKDFPRVNLYDTDSIVSYFS